VTLTLEQVFPWGRSYDEYVRMFDLTEADLAKRIVGCADGPAAFNAELTRRGGRVVSCDPLYRFGADQLRGRIEETFDHIVNLTRGERRDLFVWDRIATPEQLGHVRRAAMDVFLADYERGRTAGRYIEASLPDLPLANGAFDLALCSHLLFTYTDDCGDGFHVEAIIEMCRVAGEARIFPIIDSEARPSPHLPGVTAALAERGYACVVRPVPYQFQVGGNEMLLATRG
jgi:hypothetical protein